MTVAPIAFAAVSAPTRTAWKYGLVWFFVNTAMFSFAASAEPAQASAASAAAPRRVTSHGFHSLVFRIRIDAPDQMIAYRSSASRRVATSIQTASSTISPVTNGCQLALIEAGSCR